MVSSEERLVWTVRELAEAWKSHPQTIRTLIKDGRLKAFRIRDSEWRIPATEVERYLSHQPLPATTTPTATPTAPRVVVELRSEKDWRAWEHRMLHGQDNN